MIGLAHRPQPSLGGSLVRPRPMMPVVFAHGGGSVTRTSVLDTGADDTVVPDWIAAAIGLDLTGVEDRPIGLAGRAPMRCRYASVTIQISDGATETYLWSAVVGFVDATALPRPLLGYAGFLQYFDAEFRGADTEVTLLPNRTFLGVGP
jgi:predicted aspartyl protease